MKRTTGLKLASIVTGCLGVAALTAVGCADGRGVPTSPSVGGGSSTVPVPAATTRQTAAPALSAARSGDLHVTKECSEYRGGAGQFCTITSSNVKGIEAGSKVIYAVAATPPMLDTDVVLDIPGPGNNTAFGHCTLNLGTKVGVCTFSGGTGKFTWFHARADVSQDSAGVWHWDGSFSFSPPD